MKLNIILVSSFLIFLCVQAGAQSPETLQLGKIKMVFSLDKNGSPEYAVSYNNKPVVLPSRLGFKLNTDSLFYNSFQMIGTERRSFDQTWQTVWGETKDVRNHYEELTIRLQSTRAKGFRLNLIFR